MKHFCNRIELVIIRITMQTGKTRDRNEDEFDCVLNVHKNRYKDKFLLQIAVLQLVIVTNILPNSDSFCTEIVTFSY